MATHTFDQLWGQHHDEIVATRQAWLESLELPDADQLLFRMETLLTAMDRFFNTQNHPARSTGPISIDDDLQAETGVAARCFRELIRLSEKILDQTDTSAFVFQSYVETQLISDIERDYTLFQHVAQERPVDSLYLLQIGLRSLSQLGEGLAAGSHVSLPRFRALGHQYTAMIIQNRFFNPLSHRGFSTLYDRVDHPLLQRAVRTAPTEGLRRGMSWLILTLNRYLRVLKWIQPSAVTREELLDGLPLVTYLHSEFRSLMPFLERTFASRYFAEGPKHPKEREFLDVVDGFAFQLSMESRKVFYEMLRDFSRDQTMYKLRAGLESISGLLTTFFQQVISSFVQLIIPEVEGKDLFPDFISRLEQSLRLREEIWIFHQLAAHLILILQKPESDPIDRRLAYQNLAEFADYFANVGIKWVRSTELEMFERVFAAIRTLAKESFTDERRVKRIARQLGPLAIFLETTFNQINQRAVLQEHPFEHEHAYSILRQFMREGE